MCFMKKRLCCVAPASSNSFISSVVSGSYEKVLSCSSSRSGLDDVLTRRPRGVSAQRGLHWRQDHARHDLSSSLLQCPQEEDVAGRAAPLLRGALGDGVHLASGGSEDGTERAVCRDSNLVLLAELEEGLD